MCVLPAPGWANSGRHTRFCEVQGGLRAKLAACLGEVGLSGSQTLAARFRRPTRTALKPRGVSERLEKAASVLELKPGGTPGVRGGECPLDRSGKHHLCLEDSPAGLVLECSGGCTPTEIVDVVQGLDRSWFAKFSSYAEESALHRERVPWPYRSLVRRYFLSILTNAESTAQP